MKIVLDTNCLLVIIPKLSAYRKLFDLIRAEKISIALTTEIIAEYEEQLNAFYSENVASNVIRLLLKLEKTQLITVYYNWNLIAADEDDNKFVDCAIAANADYIITNDKHYNALKEINFPQVKCLKLEEFCNSVI